MRKIVFINRYYWPDHSATSQILTDLNLHLDAGIEQHIVTSRSLYTDARARLPKKEFYRGVCIHRAWSTRFGRSNLTGRAIDYLTFYLGALFILGSLLKRGDTVVAKTDPPLMSVVAMVIAELKGAKLVNWLQDLFPEVGQALNIKILTIRPLYRFLKYLRNLSLRAATFNVVLGDIMAEKVARESGRHDNIVVIPNWSVGEDLQPVAKQDNPLIAEWGLENRFVIGYSGNLGRAHDYRTIYQSIEHFRDDERVIFLFVGGGAGYEALKQMVETAGLVNAKFLPYQPIEQLSASLSVPDVHMISLEPNLEGLIVPSKFYGILAVARPIIFLGAAEGEIGSLVRQHKLGHTVKMGEPDELTHALNRLMEHPDQLTDNGENSRKLYESTYRADNAYRKWEQLLNDCCS